MPVSGKKSTSSSFEAAHYFRSRAQSFAPYLSENPCPIRRFSEDIFAFRFVELQEPVQRAFRKSMTPTFEIYSRILNHLERQHMLRRLIRKEYHAKISHTVDRWCLIPSRDQTSISPCRVFR